MKPLKKTALVILLLLSLWTDTVTADEAEANHAEQEIEFVLDNLPPGIYRDRRLTKR